MADHPVRSKKNRAFPLKMQLFDSDGLEVTGIDLTAAPLVEVIFTDSESEEVMNVTTELLSVGLGSDGNQFEYTEDGLWQFNLKSTNFTGPGTYVVTNTSGAPEKYVIEPACVTSFTIQ